MSIRLAILSMLAGCAVPVGMYQHNPNVLWQAPCEDPDVPLPQPESPSTPVVIKRFDTIAKVPIGAHFVAGTMGKAPRRGASRAQLPSDSMSQSYGPACDLTVPVFEAAFAGLRRAGYPVWADYQPAPELIRGPPGKPEFVVVHGLVTSLEVQTFAEAELHEAARIGATFHVLDPTGRELAEWKVDESVKIVRGAKRDVLAALGQRVALRIASRINGGLEQ